eukprot:UN1043
MALGPFTSGTLSDKYEGDSCSEACALRRAIIVVGALGYTSRALCHRWAASYFLADTASVELDQAVDGSVQGSVLNTPKCRGGYDDCMGEFSPISACTTLGKPAMDDSVSTAGATPEHDGADALL